MEDEEYKVRLDIFEGPLDLLLYLIKKDEVDVYDISIERVTKQYLEYINTFKMLNIDLASEFVVMAANLMYLKSRQLLPVNEQAEDEEEEFEEDDPRWELIRQLIEYKKFKDVAGYLGQRELEQGELFAHIPEAPKPPEPTELPPPDVGIFDLIRAFQGVLKRFQDELELGEIVDDSFTVGDKIDYLLERIDPGSEIQFSRLFEEATSRVEVIVTFLALLELTRLKQFRFDQESALGEIVVIRRMAPLQVETELGEEPPAPGDPGIA